jgi:tRNA(Arg) A34 adenosine deaminase TadA
MEAAIHEAVKSKNAGDYAIGAVIVKDSQIVARAGNRVKLDSDPTSHAEFVAIRKASMVLGSRHLENCILYTTHEPCPMCTSAAIWARMKGVVSGAIIDDMLRFMQTNGNGSGDWSWRTILISPQEVNEKSSSHKIEIIPQFMRKECNDLFHT